VLILVTQYFEVIKTQCHHNDHICAAICIQQQFCPELTQTLIAISPNLGTYIQSAPMQGSKKNIHTKSKPNYTIDTKKNRDVVSKKIIDNLLAFPGGGINDDDEGGVCLLRG